MGFSMHEVMTGRHRFQPGMGPEGAHLLEFRVDWGHPCLRTWLDPRGDEFMLNRMRGELDAVGLVEGAPCEGTLALRYLSDHRLVYDLGFEVEEVPYRLVGEKVNIRPWNLPVSHTTAFVRITEAASGRLVSTGEVYFRWRTLPSFAASFRLA